MAVLWVPVVSKEGIILEDKLVIGTYSEDQYQDVVKGIVFDNDPVENSYLLFNGTMVRYSSNVKSKSSHSHFPSKNYGVVVQLVRGSKLPLDYVRDLVLNMGIPALELLEYCMLHSFCCFGVATTRPIICSSWCRGMEDDSP
jgi:hypothetical protein